MSTAEWNVLGLLLDFVGVLMLVRYGLQGDLQNPRSWIGLALFITGTACQIWANLRWVG